MTYVIPDSVYQALKWLGLVCLPAVATFYGVCAPLWGWPAPEAVVATINAAGVLMGACLGYSALTAKEEAAQGAHLKPDGGEE